jgi:hypothetical protein
MRNERQRSPNVTRVNLPEAVESSLKECRSLLELAIREKADSELIRDLREAVNALHLIAEEIRGERPQRPKGQRSASFVRYVIDEGDSMVMDSGIRDKIMLIEDIYSRF